MTLKPLPIAGYSDQSEATVALVNQNKMLEEKVLRQLDLIYTTASIDQRWYHTARRHIEQGFMELNRSIMQPKRITGPLND